MPSISSRPSARRILTPSVAVAMGAGGVVAIWVYGSQSAVFAPKAAWEFGLLEGILFLLSGMAVWLEWMVWMGALGNSCCQERSSRRFLFRRYVTSWRRPVSRLGHGMRQASLAAVLVAKMPEITGS